MQDRSHIPFVYLKTAPKRFFSPKDRAKYYWYSKQSNSAEEFSGLILAEVMKEMPSLPLRLPTSRSAISKENQSTPSSKLLKISLEALEKLDSIPYNATDSLPTGVMRIFIRMINERLDKGYHVGINFSEIFFVPEGEKPPVYFRAGIDICVNTVEKYKNQKEKFSYQLSKFIFQYFRPKSLSNKGTSLHHMVTAEWLSYKREDNLETSPLKKLYYFDSILAACISHSVVCRETVIAFDHFISVDDLDDFYILFRNILRKEIFIVLKGKHYEDERERQRVYDTVLQLIRKKGITFFVHIFLITNGESDNTLLELARGGKKEGSFYLLPQNSGYYLSSESMIEAIYYNYQNIKRCMHFGLFFQKSVSTSAREDHLGRYIQLEKENNPVRKSKLLTEEQLKANLQLAIVHQENMVQTQNQAVNEQVQETQALAANQKWNSVQHSSTKENSFWWGLLTPKLNFDEVSCLFQEGAERILSLGLEESLAEQGGYFTQFYLDNYSRKRYLEQLANDDAFRFCQIARLFGHAIIGKNKEASFITVKLPQYYVDSLDYNTCSRSIYIGDGTPISQRKITHTLLYGRVLLDLQAPWSPQDIYIPLFPRFHLLAQLPLPLSYSILLKGIRLNKEEKKTIKLYIKNLLALFAPHSPLSTEEIALLEMQFLSLVQCYGPKVLHFEILKEFISKFESHNEDNLKILFQILLLKGREGCDIFLDLLYFLQDRSLLDHFYKVYFKYALTISSVTNLLLVSTNIPTDTFLTFAVKTQAKVENWSPFCRLGNHFSVFAAKHNLQSHGTLNVFFKLQQFWNRLSVKFLAYTGNEEEVQVLLQKLSENLADKDGLSIAPISEIKTFFYGMETLLDHAMDKNLLREQINEIKGISLLPMDVPYAITYNDFSVISIEMQLYSATINPHTKRYSVSREELLEAIVHHKPWDNFLKMASFRYLGSQTLRQDLAFYRQLYQYITEKKDPSSIYVAELLYAYYIANSTAINYSTDIDQKQFSADFLGYLEQHALHITTMPELVSDCIEDFFIQLRKISTDKQNDVQNLYTIWQPCSASAFVCQTNIPNIFFRKFQTKQLGHFLLTQKSIIEKALFALRPGDDLSWAIIRCWSNEYGIQEENKKMLHSYINAVYPSLSVKLLLDNLLPLGKFLESLSFLFRRSEQFTHLALVNLIQAHGAKTEAFLLLTNLLAAELAKNKERTDIDQKATDFLLVLVERPPLYLALPQASPFMASLLAFFLSLDGQENSYFLFQFAETMLALSGEEAQEVFLCLSEIISNENGYQWLSSHTALSSIQLKNLTQLLKKLTPFSFGWEVIQGCLAVDSTYDFIELNNLLSQISPEEGQCLLTIANRIYLERKSDIGSEVQKLKDKPLNVLNDLVYLISLNTISTKDLILLLEAPSVETAIVEFKKTLYQKNPQRYDYDPQNVREKIAQIKRKDPYIQEVIGISEMEQEHLWCDYQLLMSYMLKSSIYFESEREGEQFSINSLSDQQVKLFFIHLKDQIANKKDLHHNQLLLLALSSEALYRTLNKFPRSTQILPVLKSLYASNNVIHEVNTGEGKSIIAALQAVLLHASGRTIDIITENNELARTALKKFGVFYRYLGINYGRAIISPWSNYEDYVANGINYSTASNLALFRTKMVLAHKILPSYLALISDEIDATLMTTVQYRLAASIDPLASCAELWDKIYQGVLNFVKEKPLFIGNKCSEKDDIFNLKIYLNKNNPDKSLLKFINKIQDQLWNTLIESAMITHNLKENVDYYVVESTYQEKKCYYAAPILSSTKRPDPNVSYSEYTQQLLHSLLNNKKPAPRYPFIVEPSTETLIVISAKNFFDHYLSHKAPIIGLTGTAGSCIELTEFYELYDLVAFSYPTFYPPLAQNLGLVAAFGEEDHFKKIFEWLQEYKKRNPTQPILVITESPQITALLTVFLRKQVEWKLQNYHGYEELSKTEESVIKIAGKDEILTIANQSLGRGADIDPLHEEGLLVVNTCTQLTASELQQIQGRAARNGKRGRFISIIDAKTIAHSSDSVETIALAFKNHQEHTSLYRQKERTKRRLFEDAYYLLINHYVLKCREEIHKVLAPQFGNTYSIINNENLFQGLSELTRLAERDYAALTKNNPVIKDDNINNFLSERIKDHKRLFQQYFPERKFNQIDFVEPSILLEALHRVMPVIGEFTVSELHAFSYLFSLGWKAVGNKQVVECFSLGDEVLVSFEPFFQGQCSFIQVLGELLEKKGFLVEVNLLAILEDFEGALQELSQHAQSLPLIGPLIPGESIKNFFIDYLHTTKNQILERKWDQISLPKIDFSKIESWLKGIAMVAMVGSLIAGPIPYIINKFIIPTILSWLKDKLKKRFADSASLVAQILIGLDDIGKDLGEALQLLTLLQGKKDVKVGFFLDKLGPLLKNKALLTLLPKCLELGGHSKNLFYIQFIPVILTTLELFREEKLETIVTMPVVMAFLQQLSHSISSLGFLESNPYKIGLEQLTLLSPTFFTQLGFLSFPEFFNVLKVFSHPHFFNFLTKLPPHISCKQLCQWLQEEIPEDLPIETKDAIKQLLDYQTNPERIAEENKHRLLSLRETYTPTVDKINTGIKRLPPKPYQPQEFEKEISNQNKKHFEVKYAFILFTLCLLIVVNSIYFSIPLLLASIFVVAWMAYSEVKHMIATEKREDLSVENSSSLPPPIVVKLAKNNKAEQEPIKTVLQPKKVVEERPSSKSYSFFHSLNSLSERVSCKLKNLQI